MVVDPVGPMGDSVIVVHVLRLLMKDESSDDWRYSFKTWPINCVYLDEVSLQRHSERDVYNR